MTMKVRYILSIAIAFGLCVTTPALAQLVPIPDVNFRTFLQANYPQLMVGDDLNTAHPDLATITTLVLDGVDNSTGVQYFHALDSLTMETWSGINWPQVLPTGLRFLHLASPINEVNGPIVPLPTSLRTLELVYCGFNPGNTPLFPDSLEHLLLEDCTYSGLPVLPSGLRSLTLREVNQPWFNTMGPWPNWPSTLDTLVFDAGNSSIAQAWLDQPWPNDLAYLEIRQESSDQALVLPAWPSGLVHLVMYHVPVTEMPAWPTGLDRIDYDGGDQGGVATGCLPEFPQALTEFHWSEAAGGMFLPVMCMINHPSGLSAQSTWMPPCTIWNNTCLGANEIQGTVYSDTNNNGILEMGEIGLSLATVQVQPGNFLTSASNLGDYSLSVSAGNFTIEALPLLYHPTSGAVQTANFTGVGGQDVGNDIGLFPIPNIQDLRANAQNEPMRPGFESTVWLTYENVGTTAVNGTVLFTFDMELSFVSSVPPPDVVNGNVLEWNIATLMGQPSTNIEVRLSTSTGAIQGSPLQMSLVVDPISTDETPLDNAVNWTTPVVGSYDPNDKQVTPTELTPAQVQAGERVTYTVRFQNTGTYLAERVVITDTLSTDLQWNSIQMVAASHAYTWYLSDGVLHVLFDDIMLPDSTSDEQGSHGFVKFSIKPVTSLTLGESVMNLANIYFDFNEPVITNAAVFAVDASTSVDEVVIDHIGLVPNPAHDHVMITGVDAGETWILRDALGRAVMQGRASNAPVYLPVAGLAAGTYQVQVEGDRGMRTERLVVY